MENRAVVTLVRKLATMVDQRIEIVDVVLLDVDLESLRAGNRCTSPVLTPAA